MNVVNGRTVVASLMLLSAAAMAPVAGAQGFDDQLKPLVGEIIEGCGQAGAKRITVGDFTDLQGQVTELGRFISEELAGSLAMAKPKFGIVDRANLRMILAEHKLNMSGLVNPETARKLGQIAGVDGIVVGTITPLGDSLRISVKVIATENATIMTAARSDVARTKTMQDLLGRGVEGTSPSSTTQPRSGDSKDALPLPVYQNQLLRLAVRSVGIIGNGDILISLRIDNLTEDEMEMWCHKGGSIPFAGLDLRDEGGEIWSERGQYFEFGSNRMQLIPGTPGLASAKFAVPYQYKGVGRRFDLSGVCFASVRGRETRFPLLLQGLQPAR